jgi:hypothetical protein
MRMEPSAVRLDEAAKSLLVPGHAASSSARSVMPVPAELILYWL